MATFRVGCKFTVEGGDPPARKVLHDALPTLRALEIEAPTQEAAEHYASLIRDALERDSDRR